MTEPGDVLLDRAKLEQAFTALGDRLAQRGVVADVFIVGGAAMALASPHCSSATGQKSGKRGFFSWAPAASRAAVNSVAS
jgi:hypothetical protein